MKKSLGAQIWAKQAKMEPKIKFFVIFSSLIYQFFFKLHRMINYK